MQALEREGLWQEGVHAGVNAFLLVVGHGIGGQGHDRQPRPLPVRLLPDQSGGGKAIHQRHLAVHQHQVKAGIADLLHGL